LSFAMFLLIFVPLGLKKIPNIDLVLNLSAPLVQYWRYVFIGLSLLGTVSTLYYMMPNAKIKFSETLPGALYTVILWMICGHFLSKYIVYYNQLNVVYGSLGSIIITMLFFYIINMLFIYGAVFNYVFHYRK
jgi:membrane protein